MGIVMVPSVLGDHKDIWNDVSYDEEHAWIDNLPQGVEFPAPRFDSAGKYGDLLAAYEAMDFPQKNYGYIWGIFDVGDRKIVKGDGQDLLVFEIMIENESDSPAIVRSGQEAFKMYDGKDREFTPATSIMIMPLAGEIENAAFNWRENCPAYLRTEIQAGLVGKIKLCFEIPKDSDHFKVVYQDRRSDSSGMYVPGEISSGLILIFDKERITHSMGQQVIEPTKPTEPTSTSIELLFIALAVVAVSGIVGAVLIAKRGSNTKSAQQKLEEYEDEYLKTGNQAGNQDLEEYEKEYLARQGQRPSPKPARVEKTTLFCDSCGTPFKSEARFCGECGTPRS